jgi:hypothetical protein
VLAVLAAYLAVGTALAGAEWPHKDTWRPWSVPFVLMLIAAVSVPLYALLKYFDARQQKVETERAQKTTQERELDADMARICQEIAAAISRECRTLSLDEMAVQVWLCDEASGRFDRRWRFFLPLERNASGIEWRKGVGVAGTAWALSRNLVAPLDPLRDLTLKQYEALPEDRRYGMSHDQLRSTSAYTGIIAIPLFTAETGSTLLGMLVIDYSGDSSFECMEKSMKKPAVSKTVGSCARRLSTASFLREDGHV